MEETLKRWLFDRGSAVRGVLEEVDASAARVGIAASALSIEKMAPLEIRVADEVRVRSTT